MSFCSQKRLIRLQEASNDSAVRGVFSVPSVPFLLLFFQLPLFTVVTGKVVDQEPCNCLRSSIGNYGSGFESQQKWADD